MNKKMYKKSCILPSGFYPYLWWWGSPALCPPTRRNRPTRPGSAHQSLRASQPLLPTPRALVAPSWRRSWSGRGRRQRCSPPGRGGSRGWTLCPRGRSPVPPPPPPPGCPGEHVLSPAVAFACTQTSCKNQCCEFGSGFGSVGSVCFWASWILIRNLLSSKNSKKKNLDSYYSGRTKYSACASKLSKLSGEYLCPQKTQKAAFFLFERS